MVGLRQLIGKSCQHAWLNHSQCNGCDTSLLCIAGPKVGVVKKLYAGWCASQSCQSCQSYSHFKFNHCQLTTSVDGIVCRPTKMSTSTGSQWSEQMFDIVKWSNSFYSKDSSRSKCKPFYIGDHKVGHITPKVLQHLQDHPDVILITRDASTEAVEKVSLSRSLKTFEERTSKMAGLLQELKKLDVFVTLRGWRDEMYAVSSSYHNETLMDMERAATCLFGIKQYGVHMNGYCDHPTKGLCMWVGRRSPTKSTFPNKLDNVAAGGLPSGMTIKDCLIKECAEEASIPKCIAQNAVPAGAISYFYEDERGLFDETQFIYDLELPVDFVPKINDDEVTEFYLWTLEEVTAKIATEFKPNCALIVLDFLLRKGHLSPDTEPNYLRFLQGLHSDEPTDLFS